MIGFIALGVVMLIWVLCWDSSEVQDLGTPSSGPKRHA